MPCNGRRHELLLVLCASEPRCDMSFFARRCDIRIYIYMSLCARTAKLAAVAERCFSIADIRGKDKGEGMGSQ